MKDNVVVLTGGLTGSSVVAGLLHAAGYWTGPSTFAKPDYDTHENSDLIKLNRKLMARVGVGDEYTKYFLPEAIRSIAALDPSMDESFGEFVGRCNAHSPWLWKDPRLWLTIRFWEKLLPAAGIRFLLLDRELLQAWIALTQRRLIQTWDCTKRYHQDVQSSLAEYLAQTSRPYMKLTYESLIVRPEQELDRLTRFLGMPVTMEHLKSTYRGRLYRKNKGPRDAVEAALIYLKNFNERLR